MKHGSSSGDTVAQKKKAGERGEVLAELNDLIEAVTGRRDLRLLNAEAITVINMIKLRDAMRIVKERIEDG